MKKLFLKIICFTLLAISINAGCEQTYTQEMDDTLAVGPNIEAELSDYAARTIESSGGLNAWRETKGLQLNCVVAFYQPDESYYLTEQRYEIYPWSNSIRISTLEPQEMFVWQFSKGQFKVLEGEEQFEGLPNTVCSRCLAESILNIVTAPARFLDVSVEFIKEPAPVKMHGQWYYLIDRKNKTNVMSSVRLSDAIFYQNRENFTIDMIWFPRMDGSKLLMIRGYEFEAVEDGSVLIPKRIEIYRTDSLGISQELLVKIDCNDIKCN
jgi:hypothetical protein